jgi:hypothetical protein
MARLRVNLKTESSAIMLHVVSHGAAVNGWQPLKRKGNILRHTQHESGRLGLAENGNYL